MGAELKEAADQLCQPVWSILFSFSIMREASVPSGSHDIYRFSGRWLPRFRARLPSCSHTDRTLAPMTCLPPSGPPRNVFHDIYRFSGRWLLRLRAWLPPLSHMHPIPAPRPCLRDLRRFRMGGNRSHMHGTTQDFKRPPTLLNCLTQAVQ